MPTARQRLLEIARLRAMLIESRLDFLRQKYVPLLFSAIQQGQVKVTVEILDKAENEYVAHSMATKIPDRDRVKIQAEMFASTVFNEIVDADPDIHKKNAQWLLNVILMGGSMLEDLSKATYYLTVFEKVKRLLPVEGRDLNKYKSFADLYAAIEEKEQEMSKRELDRKADAEMHQQARVILNSSKYKIVVPLTMAASCHFGINTQWCTAATRGHNYFDEYNAKGPMYIILDKANNQRWQYHPQTGQFTNERDQQIPDVKAFMDTHPEVAEAIRAELPKPVGSIRDYPLYKSNDGFYAQRGLWNEWRKPNTVLYLSVKNNKFEGRNQGAEVFSPLEIANLLNHFGVEGDPTGGTDDRKYYLYYRPIGGELGFEDMRWQTITEVAKPIMKTENGDWKVVKSSSGYDLILVPPKGPFRFGIMC